MSKLKVDRISGYTNKQVDSFIALKLKEDDRWAVQACKVLNEQQTAAERHAHLSIAGHNGMGFNRHDAPLLTHIAGRINQNRTSDADVQSLHYKLPKYARQIWRITEMRGGINKLRECLDRYYAGNQLPFQY